MGGVENEASGIQRLGRNQEAYDKFAQAVEVPLMVVTILWLPVLIVPLVPPVQGRLPQTLAVNDYMVWALFALEYVVKLFLAAKSDQDDLRQELAVARTERDRLATKLDLLSAQTDELLRRTSPTYNDPTSDRESSGR
jgi:hypothetical protein